MIPEGFLEQTAHRFPRFIRDSVRIEPLEKGGSDRKYYRIAMPGEGSLILVKYGIQREENRHFCEIATFLRETGLRVPTIYHHDTEEQLIWVEDLGEVDLWSHRHAPWPERRALYQSTLEQAVHLHTRAHKHPLPSQLQAPFEAELYLWEQSYFFENCTGRHFGLPATTVESARNACPALGALATRLAERPRVLIHRDFQSQNILIRDGGAWLIDFQGLRFGLGEYDLASLLYDPYVPLTQPERETLIADTALLFAEAGYAVPADFREVVDLCAIQRLMQALGAYGFLGLVKEKPEFLRHISVALGSLREVVARVPGLEPFGAFLADLPVEG